MSANSSYVRTTIQPESEPTVSYFFRWTRSGGEQITFEGDEVYRMYIRRTHTAIYDVIEPEDAVEVYRLLPIDEAHKRYGQ